MNIDSLMATNSYQTSVGNPFSGGGTGGVDRSVSTGTTKGAEKTGYSAQSDINEVGIIGANKRAGFEVGLGGTNNPDDHRLFCFG